MVNKTQATLLAHSLGCLIWAWYDLDMGSVFGDRPADPLAILKLPG
jgi:hypothetical protein